jgi:hypothetical protein
MKWKNNHAKKAAITKSTMLRYTYINGMAEIASVQDAKKSVKAFNIEKHAKRS